MSFDIPWQTTTNNRKSTKSNTLSALPIEGLAETARLLRGTQRQEAIDEWCVVNSIKQKPWFYPQLLALLSTWEVYRDNGKYSAKDTILAACTNNLSNLGSLFLATSNTRHLLGSQSSITHRDYCALVPLLLAAHKKYYNVPYNGWTNIVGAVHSNLADAMLCKPATYTREELIQFSIEGRTPRSGKNAGITKKSLSSYRLYNLAKELPDGRCGLGSLPYLAATMLCQTWCADPQVRNKYMVLNPLDWDDIPEPLTTADVIQNTPIHLSALPWDL